MSAHRDFYCLVVKEVREWVEVRATSLDDASKEARKLDGVVRVEETSYIPGGVLT